MQLTINAFVATAENEDGTGTRTEPNDVTEESQEATLVDGTSHGGEFILASGQSLVLDSLGIDEVRGFYIRATGDFDLTVEVPDVVGPLGPMPIRRVHDDSTTIKARILAEMLVTSLTIENVMADLSTIRGTYRVWGVPTP